MRCGAAGQVGLGAVWCGRSGKVRYGVVRSGAVW